MVSEFFLCFYKAPEGMSFAKLLPLFKACLTLRFMAIRTFAARHKILRCHKARNTALQSSAPARRKRHACIDMLPKYIAPAKQNAKMTSHLENLKRQNEQFV